MRDHCKVLKKESKGHQVWSESLPDSNITVGQSLGQLFTRSFFFVNNEFDGADELGLRVLRGSDVTSHSIDSHLR